MKPNCKRRDVSAEFEKLMGTLLFVCILCISILEWMFVREWVHSLNHPAHIDAGATTVLQ